MGLFQGSSKKLPEPPQFPHCDARILHAPEDGCEYCNERTEWQYLRDVWGMNFTGKREPGKSLCPAEIERALTNINAWPGNVLTGPEQIPTSEEVEDAIESLKALEESLDEIKDQD
jgi:hypothetical protein